MCNADCVLIYGIKFSYEEAIKIIESQEYKKMLEIEDDYDELSDDNMGTPKYELYSFIPQG